MSIRRFVLTLPALVLLLLVGFFPGGAAFAEGGGDPLALRFVCDETVASVTVYDPAGLPLPVGADGIHHLTPGTYFYSATAEGYESTGLQAFTIPADAAGDQELRISLTPVPGSVPPDAAAPGETPSDISVPGQTPVNAPDPNAPEENPEDDGKLRIRPVDGSLTLTIERETKAESAVPPEVQNLLEGKQKPLLTADGKAVEKKLWLKTPDAEELYLDRLAVEKEIGYYTTDWTVLNLTDEEGSRKNLVPASGWYDVTVSGPATEQYRAYEPVFALVTLHWDEEGDIVDRDVQILETTHTPTKSSWSFSTDTLSTLVIAVPTDRPVESEEAAAKKDRPAFAASSTVDGVTVTVSAPSGVFPADAALWVQRVPLTEEIDAAVESERDEQKTVAVSYTFDIRVVNPETMEEYQPEEGQSVSVSFALAEVADENLETRVYHVTEEESTGALTAEALDVSESGLTATAETDGFSYYQVEFTYEKLEYVLPGDTSVPLAEILTELGLSGDVTEVSCSNTNLFSCDWTENRWVVTAHRAFSSTEWMKVTLNNVVYEITVTDYQYGDWEFNEVAGEAVITGYNGTGGDVVIPNGLIFYGSEIPVTGIGDSAFSYCDSLQSITIPSGVTSIGDYAFFNCGSLKSIEIPKSVTSIGAGAFESCGKLGSVTFVAGSELTSIGAGAFLNCCNLGSIEIPSSVTSIGDYAFLDCYDLKDIWYHGTEAQWNAICSNNGVAPAATVHYVLSITATSDPPAGGTVSISSVPGAPAVSGQGKYWSNTDVTLTATANSNYAFVNWTENGTSVSTTAKYTFTVSGDRNLTANFKPDGTIAIHVDTAALSAVAAGQSFSVPIRVTENTGFAGAELTLSYDSNKLTLDSFTMGEFAAPASPGMQAVENRRYLRVGNTTTETGVLFYANFTVKDDAAAGTVSIGFDKDTLINQDAVNLHANTTFTPGTVTIEDKQELVGVVEWNDNDNESGERPEKVTVRLMANGAESSLMEVAEGAYGIWAFSFDKLPPRDPQGKEIVYSVTADDVPEYTVEVEHVDGNAFHIKYTRPSVATTYPLWVGGVQVTSTNKGDILGNGTAAFDSASNTLTLTNANINATSSNKSSGGITYSNVVYARGLNLTVFLSGNNTLGDGSADKAILSDEGSLAITGGGSLTAASGSRSSLQSTSSFSSSSSGSISITGSTVVATSGSMDGIFADSSVTITDSTVTATGGRYGIIALTGATISGAGSVVTASGSSGAFHAKNGVTLNDGLAYIEGEATATKAVIGKAYAVNVESAENGTVTVDKASTFAGDTVTLTLSPAEGYELETLTVRQGGTDVAATKIDGKNYTFTMPAGDVTVEADFFKPAKVTLQVIKSINFWRDGDNFTFRLAAVTENAPMPAKDTATATEAYPNTAVFGEITYNSVGTYKYTITEEDGGLPGVIYDSDLHSVVVTVTKDATTNALSATVKYGGQPYLIVTNLYSGGNLKVSKTVVSENDGDKQRVFGFTVTLNNTAINGTYGDMTFLNGVATFELKNGEAKTADSLPSGIRYTVTEETAAGFTTTKTSGTGEILEGQTASASFTNKLTPAIVPTITAQPQDLNLTYGYTTDNTLTVTAAADADADYNLSYQWYSNTTASNTGGTPIPGATSSSYTVPTGKTAGTTEYYYCAVTAARTDNGQTATAESAVATVTVGKAPLTITAKDQYYVYNGQTQGEGDTTYNDQAVIAEKITVGEGQLKGTDTVTSVTIDGQGKDPDTYDLIPSGATIANSSGDVTANYNITYEKGTLTILPPATAEIKITKALEGRDWTDNDNFTFNIAAVTENAPMPAKDTATATKGAPTAVFGEAMYDKVGTWEYTITETNGGLDGVSYDTTSHTVLVTVTQAAPTAAPTAEVKYDGEASLTVTNTFTPAKAALEVTKSLNSWRAGDSFTFTLAPVNGAPMPAKDTATATEQNKKATFDEITYETAGSYEYTITETDGGISGVNYDTTSHRVTVKVTKADDATNALSAIVKYERGTSLTVTNSRPLRDVVIDSSMTGGTVTATPASAAAGDTVTLTVTPDVGSELTSLTVTNTDTGAADQNDPNLYSFVMPATGVTVSASFEEILYRVVEGADSSWLKGSNGDLSIRVKRDPKDETCFRHFRNGGSVAIDGEVLSEDSSALIQKDYRAEEGSTVITLHKKMLNRLSAGKHTVTITFDDGAVSTGLTILVPPGGYSPATGDSSRIGFWAALMVLAGLGFVGADYARRKLRRPRYVGKH